MTIRRIDRCALGALLAMQLALACAREVGSAHPGAVGGEGGSPDEAGSGGTPATGGAGGKSATGGVGGTSATGGAPGRPDAAAVVDVASSAEVAADTTTAPDARPDPTGVDASPPAAGGQGPVAEGTIVYSQDFEAGMAGITRSPTNLPADRAQVADDPLGQRGKVMKIVYLAGDNFMTIGGSTHTRSFISNTGYSFPVGATVHYAWGFLTTSEKIDAAIAQHIRSGGPMWLIEGNGDGSTYVNCRACGGKADLPVKLQPNRWYDFRVEMTYTSGGPIRFFVDGVMVLERKLTVSDPAGTKAHWDGGLYNHAAGVYTRTVYISNLSVGMK
jgi:hypothetical protein